MKHNMNPVFPEGFLWGASSAAWQVEGATLEDGRTQAIIDLNSQTKKPFADNSIASDHYHHYKEDVALMKECGFTSYRFGISWSRIIPAADRKVNPKGIEFYNNLINELKAAGIEPIVTIYHYDMPCWVDEKYGGWHDRAIIDEFDYYCRVLFENFGDRVKYWLSINEQNMQIVYGKWLGVAKGLTDEEWEVKKWQINHIMNMCHAKAVIACHEMVEDGKIGPVPGYVPIYPKSCKPEDQIAAMNAEELTEKIWNDTYAYRNYSLFVRNYWKEHGIDPKIMPGDMELMKQAKITVRDRVVAVAADERAEKLGVPCAAIELADGSVITSKTSDLLGASAALLINALKHLAGLDHSLKLIKPEAIVPIQDLKVRFLGGKNPRLHTDEVLIALTYASLSDFSAKRALEQLPNLKGCQVHTSVMLTDVDIHIFKRLGVDLTSEPVLTKKRF